MVKLSRRSLLKGLGIWGGAPFLQPVLAGLAREAYGQGATKPRLAILVFGNGLAERHYRPSGDTNNFTLPEALSPLAPHKSDLVLLEQFYNPHNQDLHGNGWALLSVRPSAKTELRDGFGAYPYPSGQTFDRFMGKKLSGGLPVESINLGLHGDIFNRRPNLSSDGAGSEYPMEPSPVRLFETHFKMAVPKPGGGGVDPAVEAELRRDKTVWTLVRDDVMRMRAKLPTPEREKLDQYVESITQLEKKVTTVAPMDSACASMIPAPPPANLPTAHENWPPLMHKDLAEAQVDMLANLLIFQRSAVGLFHVFGGGAFHHQYVFLGERRGEYSMFDDNNKDIGLHGAYHHGGDADVVKRQDADAFAVKIQQWNMSLVARLWKRLGDCGLTRDTMLMVLNAGGGMHHNGTERHAVMLFGAAGGRIKTGRYLRFARNQRCLSEVYVAVAQALGAADVTTFGTPEHCKGPVPGLLT